VTKPAISKAAQAAACQDDDPGYTLRALPSVRARLVAAGASTGGPEALLSFLHGLGRPNAPVLVAMHMGEAFADILVSLVARQAGLPAQIAREGERLESGVVYFAPGGQHLQVEANCMGLVARLEAASPDCRVKPSVDMLFASAAAACGSQVFAVVLSGMGDDGLLGARALAQAGAAIAVQDSQSAAVWGMPSAIARAGLACAVAAPSQIGALAASRLALVAREAHR